MRELKTLLVTGGCGFIGSNYIRHIFSKYPDIRVTNLDALTYAGNPDNLKDLEGNPRYRFVHGNICDPETVRTAMKNQDAVMHFAAESHVDNSIASPNIFQKTNVEGTLNLLNAARQTDLKFFFHVSTDEVYGSTETSAFSEKDPLSPSSPYSASKAASDLFVQAYHKTYGLPVVITRSSNNFGPHQFPEKLIPLFITNLLEGKKVPLYGDGLNVRDWIYVRDNVDAIDFIARNGSVGEVYNIAGNHEKKNVEITKDVLKALGKDDAWIEYVQDRPGHDRRYAISADKLQALGWTPKYDFLTALQETIEWYQANESWWKPLKGRKK